MNVTAIALPSHASVAIGLTPPRWLRNCAGGFT